MIPIGLVNKINNAVKQFLTTDWRFKVSDNCNDQYAYGSYSANQSEAELVAAPAAGTEIVVTGFNVSGVATSGEVTLIGGKRAAATIGEGDNGVVTVTATAIGETANDYTLEVVVAAEADTALSASLESGAYTVTLGTDSEGDADATKNTATLIAAALDALDNIGAAASGTGAGTILEAVASQNLTGGTPLVHFGKLLATKVNSNVSDHVNIPCGEASPVAITSTTGETAVFVGLNYDIRAV